LLLLLPAAPAAAVGLEGSEEASHRLGAGVSTGWDQVGGIGRDAFPFVEGFAHADARVWRWLAVGGALSVRGDLGDYNFALERWRGRSGGLAAQLAVGYDGPAFHVSAGPWIYGDGRDGRDFRAALLPWGVLRLRFGNLDRWHVNLRILDGGPYTAEGGGTGVRLQVGAPPRGNHRMAAGLYTSLGEKTVGLTFSDEITVHGWPAPALRVGGMLGTDVGHFDRPELTAFAGLVW
jgi:hypothetical protein